MGDETDRDREVKTEKGQNEADQENENDDQEVEIGKIENDEADHVRENPKKYPTDQKKKDARNQNQRAAKKKIENLPIPAILTKKTLNCHLFAKIYFNKFSYCWNKTINCNKN